MKLWLVSKGGVIWDTFLNYDGCLVCYADALEFQLCIISQKNLTKNWLKCSRNTYCLAALYSVILILHMCICQRANLNLLNMASITIGSAMWQGLCTRSSALCILQVSSCNGITWKGVWEDSAMPQPQRLSMNMLTIIHLDVFLKSKACTTWSLLQFDNILITAIEKSCN